MMRENAVRQFPITIEQTPSEPARKTSWFWNLWHSLGVVAMPNNQSQPSGFFVNWTSLAAIASILALIAGLYWFTYQQGLNSGYEKGKAETEKLQMQRQIDEAKQSATKAKDIALGVQGDAAAEQSEKKKK